MSKNNHIWAKHDVQLPFIYVPFDSVQPNWKARNTGDKEIKKVILPESTSEKRIDFRISASAGNLRMSVSISIPLPFLNQQKDEGVDVQ